MVEAVVLEAIHECTEAHTPGMMRSRQTGGSAASWRHWKSVARQHDGTTPSPVAWDHLGAPISVGDGMIAGRVVAGQGV